MPGADVAAFWKDLGGRHVRQKMLRTRFDAWGFLAEEGDGWLLEETEGDTKAGKYDRVQHISGKTAPLRQAIDISEVFELQNNFNDLRARIVGDIDEINLSKLFKKHGIELDAALCMDNVPAPPAKPASPQSAATSPLSGPGPGSLASGSGRSSRSSSRGCSIVATLASITSRRPIRCEQA